MTEAFNVYCDESCHIEHDHQPAMVLGAIWCPREKVREICVRIRDIKGRHCLARDFEIKWTKVSPAAIRFYLDVVDYFFDDDDLHFRALVVPDKTLLRHEDFGQSHDEWYYKMYFDMLKVILKPHALYSIYLDIKDSCGGRKVARLHEVLCNSILDFSRDIVENIQIVRSDEVEIIQMADLLIGAVSYTNRRLSTSTAKLALVARMRERSGYRLTRSTLFREDKINIFIWRAS